MSLGDKIKTLRERKCLTQQELADLLYVSRQTVCRWEKGTRCPDIYTAKKLANELNTSVDELISDAEINNNGKREKIESQSLALEGLAAVSQIFVIICLARGDDAWRAFLAISLFGFTFLCYKRWSYRFEKQWAIIGFLCFLMAVIMSVKFFY